MQAPTYGTVSWFQIGTDDPETVKRFYGDLFGWSFAADPDNGGKYDLITYPGAQAPSGGIAHTDGDAPNHAIFLVVVEDVAAVAAQTEEIGGKVLMPPTTTPDGLVFGHLLDPSGNHFGVFTPPSGG
jgi:uncharacterized protein